MVLDLGSDKVKALLVGLPLSGHTEGCPGSFKTKKDHFQRGLSVWAQVEGKKVASVGNTESIARRREIIQCKARLSPYVTVPYMTAFLNPKYAFRTNTFH